MTTREKARERVEKESYISEDFVRGFLEGMDLEYSSFRSSLERANGGS